MAARLIQPNSSLCSSSDSLGHVHSLNDDDTKSLYTSYYTDASDRSGFCLMKRDFLPRVCTTPPAPVTPLSVSLTTQHHPWASASTLACPMCGLQPKNATRLWRHINVSHASRSEHPPVQFYHLHKRLVGSRTTCQWAYHERFATKGCQHPCGGSHCNGSLIPPEDAPFLAPIMAVSSFQSPSSPTPDEPPHH